MKHFWTHKERIPEGYGYGQFSRTHFLWIALTVIATVLTALFYRGCGPVQKISVLRTIAAILMISEVIKMTVIGISDVNIFEYLPLEVCSFAGYFIVCDSIWPKNPILPQMLLTLFFPAAVMALLFPTTTTLPSFNFFTIHQFLYHGLLVIYIMARFLSGEITLTYPGVWSSVFMMLILVAVIYFIDVKFDKNFMFLRGTSDNPMLEIIYNRSKGNIGYFAGLVCFSICVIHIFFLLFKVIEILFLK